MKYVVIMMVALVMGGCSVAVVDFIEGIQIPGQHEKAMEFLGSNPKSGTIVFKHTEAGKACLKRKRIDRGYYVLQDDLDCAKLP